MPAAADDPPAADPLAHVAALPGVEAAAYAMQEPLGDDRIIKLFGLGLAAAVFIDAVIIRSVLVPAVMQLLGRRAWCGIRSSTRCRSRTWTATPSTARSRSATARRFATSP